jgi:ABC-type glycerol-3-phosphate transport system permease component
MQLFPVAWLLYSSVKTNSDLYTDIWAPPIPPMQVSLGNYLVSWTGGYVNIKVGTYLMNSLTVALTSLLILVFCASLAGYAIARLNMRFSSTIFYTFLALISIPTTSVVIPLFVMIRSLGLIDNPWGLILPYVAYNVPFCVVLARAYFKGFPFELEEAAKIDGCSDFGAFWRIVMPISKGMLAALAIVSFPGIWNELLFALVITTRNDTHTLPVGLLLYVGQYATRLDYMFAGLSINVIALMIFYVIFNRYIVRGVVAGSLKG